VHYNSNVAELKKILKVKPENIEVIYHPTFEDSYPNTISQREARKCLGIPDDMKVLLCFGQIRKYKGMEIFANAMEKLDKSYLGLLVGKPVSNEVVFYLKNKEKDLDNLEVISQYVPDAEIQVYLNASDVVVLPYTTIATSGVVLLAYAFGRPVITTQLGGMPEVVMNKKTGILVPPNNVDALKEGIEQLFTLDYKSMGKNAQQIGREMFSWLKLAEQTLNVYKNTLK